MNVPTRPARLLVLAAALAAWRSAGRAQEPSPFRWGGKLSEGQVVQVKGVRGAIHAERWAGDSVVVVATRRQGREGSPEAVRLEVVTHADGVTVCAVYPGGVLAADPSVRVPPNRCAPGPWENLNVRGNDTRVDFEVRLPAGVGFDGSVMDGDVRVDSVRGDVHAMSASGDVTVRDVDGEGVIASALAGRVSFRGALHPRGWYRFSTLSGTVDVTLPDRADALVTLKTVNGRVESDYPLPAAATVGAGPMRERVVTLPLGSGAARVDLGTMNGAIRLHGGGPPR